MTQNVRINSRVEERSDELANDSDKSFVVPEGFEWDIQQIYLTFSTTATVGNRQITIEIISESGTLVLANIHAGAVQAASLVQNYNFAPGLADQTTLISSTLNTSFPKLRLAPTEILRVFDSAFIDVAADDMDVRLMIQTNRI